MPNAFQLIDNCSTRRVYLMLDLKAEFHNVQLLEATKEVSGIAMQKGLYRWTHL